MECEPIFLLERRRAERAFEKGLYALMQFLVDFQIVSSREIGPALLALMGSQQVSPPVSVEINLLCEREGAFLASKRLDIHVDADMLIKGTLCREGFRAFGAFKLGDQASMLLFVLSQSGSKSKGGGALGTLIGFDAEVHFFVFPQMTFCGETAQALIAFERLKPKMN